jgi:hypothetical protein
MALLSWSSDIRNTRANGSVLETRHKAEDTSDIWRGTAYVLPPACPWTCVCADDLIFAQDVLTSEELLPTRSLLRDISDPILVQRISDLAAIKFSKRVSRYHPNDEFFMLIVYMLPMSQSIEPSLLCRW